jgi:DNA polymerase
MAIYKIKIKNINLLEYYSNLNVINFYNNDVKSKDNNIFDRKKKITFLLEEVKNISKVKVENENFFYKGNLFAKIMILGFQPSLEDINNKLIFSNKRGELLDKMLSSIMLNNDLCYFTNIFFDNDANLKLDNLLIKKILDKHLSIIQPRIILMLGDKTYNFFNNDNKNILNIHGEYTKILNNNKSIDALTTFDPSELLTNPEYKKLAWQDLKKFRNFITKINA